MGVQLRVRFLYPGPTYICEFLLSLLFPRMPHRPLLTTFTTTHCGVTASSRTRCTHKLAVTRYLRLTVLLKSDYNAVMYGLRCIQSISS